MNDMHGRQPTGEAGASAFATVALVLQGGGALGSFQGGVYEALAGAGVHPNWVSGISIGAINAALIAGNPPEKRVEKLREFWETVSRPPLGPLGLPYNPRLGQIDDIVHRAINQFRAFGIATLGAPGFFHPRLPSPLLFPSERPDRLSLYDVTPLRGTLERLVDFDRVNSGATRLSVGAVNIGTGLFRYFDSAEERIDFRHIIASGSLPPGFPATEIDGEYFWDGGIVSNTPLQAVFEARPRRDTLAIAVDLWSGAGPLPHSLPDAEVRLKDIQFASHTQEAIRRVVQAQRVRHAYRKLHLRLPEELRDSEEALFLVGEADDAAYQLAHLTYHSKAYEGSVKDFEFSRRTMEEHWRAGHEAASRALAHPDLLQRPDSSEGFRLLDFSRHD